MSSSKFLASLVALLAIFTSFKLYNNPAISEITMTGPEMKAFENPEVLKHVKKIQDVATPVRPALPSERGGWAMAWLHLVIWNSWKSAYFYADKYPKEDFNNYVEYALTAVEFLEGHHDAEEKTLFPTIEKKIPGSMEKNEAQHEAFLKPLGELRGYLESTKAGSAQFDAATYRAKVDSILLPIMEHLADELDSLNGPSLLKHFTEDELASINTLTHKAQQGDNHKNLPLILLLGRDPNLTCLPQNLPPNSPFPPAPAFVTKLSGALGLLLEVQPSMEGNYTITAYPALCL
ncbi:hypothetical protein VNI00_016824 [Paramarasmius palmivorus]|uniref:Hemerythrin-like domain-containing protein n=1 Tax=Paramarasmius palmivorus TaxID=297713 RepID=A0AAW0BB96_9AGAR